jgi:hypothetical protein
MGLFQFKRYCLQFAWEGVSTKPRLVYKFVGVAAKHAALKDNTIINFPLGGHSRAQDNQAVVFDVLLTYDNSGAHRRACLM